MSTREEPMQKLGVFVCPDWCTKDEEAEAELNQHIGEWVAILTDAGVAQAVTVWARSRRNWANASGDVGSGEGYAEVDYECADGGDPPEWLRASEVQDLNDGLFTIVTDANEVQEWVWAYDGAAEDAALALDAVA